MPTKLKTRCNHPGCSTATRGRFCNEHARPAHRIVAGRRGSRQQRGYDAQWMEVAQLRRRLDAELCQPCRKDGYLTFARIVDHVVPIHVRPDWRLAVGNTQVICSPCHQKKTAEDTATYGSRTATILTAQQRENRARAQATSDAPREAEFEVSCSCH